MLLIVSAENFKVNKMSYTIISFYKCENSLNLTETQFDKLVSKVQTYSKFKPFFVERSDGSKFTIYNDEFRTWLNLSKNSDGYITLTTNYWIFTYSLQFNESENYEHFDTRIDSLRINGAGVWEHLRNNVNSVCSNHEMSMLIYYIYDYNGSISCLENKKDIFSCENDLDYQKLTKRFDFPTITDNRLHEYYVNDDIIILDKAHLGETFENGLRRELIISQNKMPSIEYGIFRNIGYEEQLKYILDLRQVPYETKNIISLNNRLKLKSIEIDGLLNKIRKDLTSFFPIKVFFNKKDISELNNINLELANESLLLNEKSSLFNDLKNKNLDNIFYVKYFSKFYDLYIPRFDDAIREYKETLGNTKILVGDVWSTLAQVKAIAFTSLTVLIASIALILDIVTRWKKEPDEKNYRHKILTLLEKLHKEIQYKLKKSNKNAKKIKSNRK